MKARTSGAHGAAILARDSQPQKGNPLVQTSKQAFHYSVKKRESHISYISHFQQPKHALHHCSENNICSAIKTSICFCFILQH